MPYTLKCSKIKVYAEDTSLAYSAKNASDIFNIINYEQESLRKWLHTNRLSLTVANTTSMLIGTKTAMQDKSNGKYLRQSSKQ